MKAIFVLILLLSNQVLASWNVNEISIMLPPNYGAFSAIELNKNLISNRRLTNTFEQGDLMGLPFYIQKVEKCWDRYEKDAGGYNDFFCHYDPILNPLGSYLHPLCPDNPYYGNTYKKGEEFRHYMDQNCNIPNERFKSARLNYIDRNSLHLTSLRIDPCNGSKCQKQVRLVFQADGGNGEEFNLHVGYELNKGDFNSLAKKLKYHNKKYKNKLVDLPLQIHPIIKAQGIEGDYFQGLKNIITKYIGNRRLRRVTAMVRGIYQTEWIKAEELASTWDKYLGAPPFEDALYEIKNKFSYKYYSELIGLFGLEYHDLNDRGKFIFGSRFTHHSYDILDVYDLYDMNEILLEKNQESWVKNMDGREHLNQVNFDISSCIACHAPNTFRQQAHSKYGSLDIAGWLNYPNSYLEKIEQQSIMPEDLALVAFGHYKGQAIIHQRTVKESMQSVKDMNELGY